MGPEGRTAEKAIGKLASASHGVVTRMELLDAGLTPAEIKHRLSNGVLLPVHRGVYRVGHRAPSVEASYLAAVKACGPGALLCGRAAAHLWGLLKGSPPPPEVLAPTERRLPGVAVHRARGARPTAPTGVKLADGATCRGIPVTTVPRTLLDLAGCLTQTGLARACHEAGVLYRTTPNQVEAAIAVRPNARGARVLRRILGGEIRVTMSRLEARFLQRLREAHLPLPETNRRVGNHRVDCRWPKHRLTVELDGFRYHSTRHAWERDRRREREARGRGDEFRRYSYGDVYEDPAPMLSELRALLRPGPRLS